MKWEEHYLSNSMLCTDKWSKLSMDGRMQCSRRRSPTGMTQLEVNDPDGKLLYILIAVLELDYFINLHPRRPY